MSDGGEVSIKFSAKDQQSLYEAIAEINKRLDQTGVKAEVVAPKLNKADAALKSFADRIKDIQTSPLERFASQAGKLDESLAKGLLTLPQHQRAVAEGLARLAAETDDTDHAMVAFANSIKTIQAGPLGVLTAETAKLDEALQKNLLTAEEHGAALAAAQEKYAKAIDKTDHGLKAFAERIKQLNATPLDRLREKQEMLTRAVKSGELTETQAAKAAKRHQDEYQRELDETKGKQAALGAGAVAAGALIASAWTTALSKVQQLATAMRTEHERALSVQQATGRTLGSLAQLANSPEELQALTDKARGLVRTGAAPDIGQAVQAIFAASSAGALGDLESISKLAIPGVVTNIPETIRSTAALRAALGGEAAGSTSDIMAKAFAAAAPTTTTAEQLTVGAARAGSQAKTMGVTVDELLSATGILATAKGSAEEGGTRMASLLRGMEDDVELRGKSFVDMLTTLQARALQPEELTKQLTAEGADAFRILANNLEQLTATIEAARRVDTQGEIARRGQMAMGVPAIAADVLAKQVKAEGDLRREVEGRVVALRDAAIEQGVLERRSGGRGGVLDIVPFARHLPERIKSELNAMAFGNMAGTAVSVPGSVWPEAMAASERTAPGIREALTAAITERDAERAQFAATIKAASEKFERSAAAIERAATKQAGLRPDMVNAARREAAVAADR